MVRYADFQHVNATLEEDITISLTNLLVHSVQLLIKTYIEDRSVPIVTCAPIINVHLITPSLILSMATFRSSIYC